MSDQGEGKSTPNSGYRKNGKPFKAGNIREDGSYATGRNRPPKKGQFAAGDGRKRGRRSKNVPNADTDFLRELDRKIVVRENGKDRKTTKGHAVDLRLIDNATRKGDNKAIDMIDQRRQRITESAESNRHRHTLADREILEAYLRERSEELSIAPDLFGDPEPELGAGESDD